MYINVYFYYSPFIIFVLEYTKYIIICNSLCMEQNTYIGSNAYINNYIK